MALSRRRRLQRWLGELLLSVSDVIEHRIDDPIFELGYKLAEHPEETPEERELSEARSRDNVARILARVRHRCPECDGKCYVHVPDGWTRCQTCKGTGIDPSAPEPA